MNAPSKFCDLQFFISSRGRFSFIWVSLSTFACEFLKYSNRGVCQNISKNSHRIVNITKKTNRLTNIENKKLVTSERRGK